jgi:hypothetical protein
MEHGAPPAIGGGGGQHAGQQARRRVRMLLERVKRLGLMFVPRFRARF